MHPVGAFQATLILLILRARHSCFYAVCASNLGRLTCDPIPHLHHALPFQRLSSRTTACAAMIGLYSSLPCLLAVK